MNQAQRSSAYKDPTWWNSAHSSGWERTKEALRRDWEQTKADISKGGHDLNQDVGDTVKQSMGKEPIPPGNRPNSPSAARQDWNEYEPAVRYGYGARAITTVRRSGTTTWKRSCARIGMTAATRARGSA